MFKMSTTGGHTYAFSRLLKSFTALLMAFSGKADQTSCSAFLNSEIAFGLGWSL